MRALWSTRGKRHGFATGPARLLTALGLTKTQDLVELRRMFETY